MGMITSEEVLRPVLAQQEQDEKIVLYRDSESEIPILRSELKLGMLKKQKGFIVISNRAFYMVWNNTIVLKVKMSEISEAKTSAEKLMIQDFYIKTGNKEYKFAYSSITPRNKVLNKGPLFVGVQAAGVMSTTLAMIYVKEMFQVVRTGVPTKELKLARIEMS